MFKIYVGCAIAQAPPEFLEAILSLKKVLRGSYSVFDFVPPTVGTPTEVYRNDIDMCVAECDLLLAICDYPSLGLGYEMGTAIERFDKPVLAVACLGVPVSRLITGIPHEKFLFRRYSTLSDVLQFVNEKIKGDYPK